MRAIREFPKNLPTVPVAHPSAFCAISRALECISRRRGVAGSIEPHSISSCGNVRASRRCSDTSVFLVSRFFFPTRLLRHRVPLRGTFMPRKMLIFKLKDGKMQELWEEYDELAMRS